MKKLIILTLILIFLTQATEAHRLGSALNLYSSTLRPMSTARSSSARVGYVDGFFHYFEDAGRLDPDRDIYLYRYIGKKPKLAPVEGMVFMPGEYYVLRCPTLEPELSPRVNEILAQLRIEEGKVLHTMNPDNTFPQLPKVAGMAMVEGRASLLVKRVDGENLKLYTQKVLNAENAERRFVDLIISILDAYEATYLAKGYVNGDLDAGAIMIASDADGKAERIVFVDNDSTTSLSQAPSRIDIAKKRLIKPSYVTDDRYRRAKSRTIDPAEICVPRDDIYSICNIFIDLLIDYSRSVEIKDASLDILQIMKILGRYSKLSEKEYVVDGLREALKAEIEKISAEPNGPRASSAGSETNSDIDERLSKELDLLWHEIVGAETAISAAA